ncbi:transcriptional regulator [Candidatus Saccharibacteria bacterium]|nr:transcriptional regulator [Candidatus Saccharibacteria bacterium]
MVEQLFGSKTRVKLLKLFYSNPNRPFYVREITRKIDEQINSVRRELANLLSIGIITSDNNNDRNRLYYEVNQKYEYYDPLSAIFGGTAMKPKAFVAPEVNDAESDDLTSLGNVDLVIYSGQFTRDDRAGVDFLIVGDVNPTKVSKYVAGLEEQEGRDVRYAVMTPKEFDYRRQINDRFLSILLDSKLQVVLDRNYLITPRPKEQPKKESTKKKAEKE